MPLQEVPLNPTTSGHICRQPCITESSQFIVCIRKWACIFDRDSAVYCLSLFHFYNVFSLHFTCEALERANLVCYYHTLLSSLKCTTTTDLVTTDATTTTSLLIRILQMELIGIASGKLTSADVRLCQHTHYYQIQQNYIICCSRCFKVVKLGQLQSKAA